MQVYDIPAYSYFAGSSYRTDIFLVSDDKLCKKINTEYQDTSWHVLWSESGQTYDNIYERCNELLGAPVFSPNYRLYQLYNDNSTQPMSNYYPRIQSDFKVIVDAIKITNDYTLPSVVASSVTPDSMIALNTDVLGASDFLMGNVNRRLTFMQGGRGFTCTLDFGDSLDRVLVEAEIAIYPERLFVNDVIIDQTTFETDNTIPVPIYVRLNATYTTDLDGLADLISYNLSVRNFNKRNAYLSLKRLLENYHITNSGMVVTVFDDTNPYGTDGTSYPGGGDGTLGPGGLDFVDPALIPDIPTIGAASCGFMQMYNPSVGQLQALAAFMWSDAFDMNSYKKLFSDPMESIIGLAIVPIEPSISGSKNVTFGSIDSGISMPTIGNQYKKLDCGSVSIEKYVGCFMDYAPYTKVSIYLPYIGIRELSPDDITGGSINVQYIVDVLTGACACFIAHSSRGVLYSYNGSCITNVPLTAANFSGAIQNAVSAVIGGVGVIAGMATGAAPITAMGAASLLNSAANTAMNSKPQIQRSGNLGGSAGIMSIQTPYIIIERPNLSVPYNVQNFVGQTSNMTSRLGNIKGFTMVEYIHLHDVAATSDEIKEIEALLKEGVIL
jgi:hypothetical protein